MVIDYLTISNNYALPFFSGYKNIQVRYFGINYFISAEAKCTKHNEDTIYSKFR